MNYLLSIYDQGRFLAEEWFDTRSDAQTVANHYEEQGYECRLTTGAAI